ncbi:MAG: peptide deformylase [Chloroflexi bacterium]|nr:peptide deformylase [Chloroflexota bacterium]
MIAALAVVGGYTIADKVSAGKKETLPVVMYPNEVLRNVAQPVGDIGEEERQLATLMVDTLEKTDAHGLSAPQVGVSRRIIAVKLGNGVTSGFKIGVMVNPEIIAREGSSADIESCLSLPKGRKVEVTRSDRITVRYLTLSGEEATLEVTGSDACMVQHEIDHLDGIIIIDYAKKFNLDSKVVVGAIVIYAVALSVASGLYISNRMKERKAR